MTQLQEKLDQVRQELDQIRQERDWAFSIIETQKILLSEAREERNKAMGELVATTLTKQKLRDLHRYLLLLFPEG